MIWIMLYCLFDAVSFCLVSLSLALFRIGFGIFPGTDKYLVGSDIIRFAIIYENVVFFMVPV